MALFVLDCVVINVLEAPALQRFDNGFNWPVEKLRLQKRM